MTSDDRRTRADRPKVPNLVQKETPPADAGTGDEAERLRPEDVSPTEKARYTE